MKSIKGRLFSFALLLTLILGGCGGGESPTSSETTEPLVERSVLGPDTTPPAVPRNLKVVLGDNQVTLLWDANTDTDMAGYHIKRKDAENRTYTVIGSVPQNAGADRSRYVDKNVHNGNTYWYVVTSYDDARPTSNESTISDAVSATPRPEGEVTLTIGDGFDFATHKRVPGNSSNADMVYDYAEIKVDGVFNRIEGRVHDVMIFQQELWVQDMGYTDDFSVIDSAPYFPKADEEDVNDPVYSYTGVVTELDIGHTYVVWFNQPGEAKDRYAKFRVAQLGLSAGLPNITLEWAIQEKPNTPQLAPALMIDSKRR